MDSIPTHTCSFNSVNFLYWTKSYYVTCFSEGKSLVLGDAKWSLLIHLTLFIPETIRPAQICLGNLRSSQLFYHQILLQIYNYTNISSNIKLCHTIYGVYVFCMSFKMRKIIYYDLILFLFTMTIVSQLVL